MTWKIENLHRHFAQGGMQTRVAEKSCTSPGSLLLLCGPRSVAGAAPGFKQAHLLQLYFGLLSDFKGTVQ